MVKVPEGFEFRQQVDVLKSYPKKTRIFNGQIHDI